MKPELKRRCDLYPNCHEYHSFCVTNPKGRRRVNCQSYYELPAPLYRAMRKVIRAAEKFESGEGSAHQLWDALDKLDKEEKRK